MGSKHVTVTVQVKAELSGEIGNHSITTHCESTSKCHILSSIKYEIVMMMMMGRMSSRVKVSN